MRAWLHKHFPSIDKNVDRIGYWAGFFALLWFVMSGIAGSISGLAQYGWAAAAFAGLAVACGTSLAVTGSLALYRYFNPLPPASPPKSLKPILSEKVMAASNPQMDRDIASLFDLAIDQSAMLMFDHLLRLSPKNLEDSGGPLKVGGKFEPLNAGAQEFIRIIRDRMDPGTERRANFERVLSRALALAEDQLEKTPASERPADVDALILRKWAITHAQCMFAISFLRSQRDKTEENILNQRMNLLNRWAERNR